MELGKDIYSYIQQSICHAELGDASEVFSFILYEIKNYPSEVSVIQQVLEDHFPQYLEKFKVLVIFS